MLRWVIESLNNVAVFLGFSLEFLAFSNPFSTKFQLSIFLCYTPHYSKQFPLISINWLTSQLHYSGNISNCCHESHDRTLLSILWGTFWVTEGCGHTSLLFLLLLRSGRNFATMLLLRKEYIHVTNIINWVLTFLEQIYFFSPYYCYDCVGSLTP